MTLDPLPDLTGRTVVVTGANAGIGRFGAEQLAAAGARVVLACRNPDRASAAMQAVRALHPAAELDVVRLDLADLGSVAAAAESLRSLGGIDVLLCNAGNTGTSRRRTTKDGFEWMMGVNHLGHFALTAQVLPALRPGARIVAVGSLAHRWSPIDVDDLQAERHFRSFRQYGRTKSAVMMFAFELDRRAREAGRQLTAVAAHPGFALDSLSPARPDLDRPSAVLRVGARVARGWICQGKDAGAWPLVHAAAAAGVQGGDYWGPGGRQEVTGRPGRSTARAHTRDAVAAKELWAESERLTGLTVPIG
ncbi:MAG TPA: SDR family NAD(P)-dependent oxidoreductase [Pseudonocardiaceae bacterium]|jgi:NAD(P)-dependent dehydrogenase (short-subunit alcohol dehydrogenase family)